MITTSMFTIFLTIVVVMILNSFLTSAFIVGAIEYLYEKYELKKKEDKPTEKIIWEKGDKNE